MTQIVQDTNSSTLHLGLTNQDLYQCSQACKTKADAMVFLYIRTLDPFGDRALQITTKQKVSNLSPTLPTR